MLDGNSTLLLYERRLGFKKAKKAMMALKNVGWPSIQPFITNPFWMSFAMEKTIPWE